MATIGITIDSKSQDEHKDQHGALLMQRLRYANIIHALGHNLVILPYCYEQDLIDQQISMIDGLIVPGGNLFVGQGNASEITLDNLQLDERSKYEIPLIRGSMAQEMPILGICWGQQLLNLVLGGSLQAKIEQSSINHDQKPPFNEPTHSVSIASGCKLREIVGSDQIEVNSSHNQAVKTVGNGVKVNATAPDGVIEGIELEAAQFVLGVQWHPEFEATKADHRIFEAFTSSVL